MKFVFVMLVCAVTNIYAQEMLQLQARAGNVVAMAELSDKFRRGETVSVNEKESFEYAMQGAQKDYALSTFQLAECYQYGIGTTKDNKRAWELYKKSLLGLYSITDKNVGRAQFALYSMYENGNGVKPNLDSAKYYLHKAAEGGLTFAQMTLGKKLLLEAKTSEDAAQADELLHKAAEQRCAEPMLVWSNRLSNSSDSTKQRESFLFARNAAQLGYTPAKYVVGAYYYAGYGIQRDTVESLTWFTQAANDGYELACFELGYRYTFGYGVPKDAVKARKWLLTLSAISNEMRDKTYNRYRTMLDSAVVTDSINRIAVSSTMAWMKNFHTSRGTTAQQYESYLYGNARKLWKLLGNGVNSNESTILAFGKEKTMRQVINKDEMLVTKEGTLSLEHSAESLVLTTESGKQEFMVLLISPSLLILKSVNSSNPDALADVQMYELMMPADAAKAGGFNGKSNKFAEPKVKLKKAEINAEGTVYRLTYNTKNIPSDGLNIRLATYRYEDDSKNNEYAILPEQYKGDDILFADGEYTIEWDLTKALLKKGKGDCIVQVEYGYMFDGKYVQLTEDLRPIDVTGKRKK